MSKRSVPLAIALLISASCATVPQPANLAPGTPHISWVIMYGDRDNPDQEFACQSEPRSDCVVPPSRADAQVFTDVHVYYHGAGAETRYEGSFEVGFLQGSPAGHKFTSKIGVQKGQSITNQSVHGIVTSTPGNYSVTFELTATVSGKTQPIQERIAVAVR